MMPSLSLASSSSSVSSTVRVIKATSELLNGPDWTLNMEICDFCNTNNWLAKGVVKEVRRRLQHKNPKVQLLTLTLLETLVKNCGAYIHFHISEYKVVDEMIKIVKKKTSIPVRDKILVLLDSWQEAFGGPGGKYSQYYWACDELRRYGVQFPQRSQRTAPIITPPVTHQPKDPQVGLGIPANSSRGLDEVMTSEVEALSFSTLESMRNVLEILDDMLQAVNPNDRMAVKDEVIVDLVDRCRANQKKLMQMIATTMDEEILVRGIETNDSLQSVLAKHDAIASGAPLPNSKSHSGSVDCSLNKTSEARNQNPAPNAESLANAAHIPKDQVFEEEEEDEFAQLARRHSKTHSPASQTTTTEDGASSSSSSSSSNVLVLIDEPTPTPVDTSATKEQDLIDLLSLVLTTSSTSSETPPQPLNSTPPESAFQASFNNYVVPWAQPQPQPQQPLQSLPQLQTQYQAMQPQWQQPTQQGYSQYSSGYGYPPPPWEPTSGYTNHQNPYVYPTSQATMNGFSVPMQGTWSSFQNSQYGNHQPMYPFQNQPVLNGGNLYSTSQQATMNPSSMPLQGVRVSNGSDMNGNALMGNGSGGIPMGQKPFIPSYRLFEDLNVFGSPEEGKLKSRPYPSASGNPSQNMIS